MPIRTVVGNALTPYCFWIGPASTPAGKSILRSWRNASTRSCFSSASMPSSKKGIDTEEKQDRVDAFLHDLKIDFPAGVDAGPIQKQYGVSAFPTTVLIGVDGKVQFYETGALANAEVAFDN